MGRKAPDLGLQSLPFVDVTKHGFPFISDFLLSALCTNRKKDVCFGEAAQRSKGSKVVGPAVRNESGDIFVSFEVVYLVIYI